MGALTPENRSSGNDKTARQHTPEWLEDRLRTATTPDEIAQLLRLREEFIKQEERIAQGEHRRSLQRLQIVANVVKSAFGLAAGTALVWHGNTYPGLFILGASLYSVAPEFVMSFFRRKEGNDHDAEK